jgi:hypothetical protein
MFYYCTCMYICNLKLARVRLFLLMLIILLTPFCSCPLALAPLTVLALLPGLSMLRAEALI